MSVVLGAIALAGFVVVVLWLILLPGGEDEEELLGFVAANWNRIDDEL